jgi:hypothetical protein
VPVEVYHCGSLTATRVPVLPQLIVPVRLTLLLSPLCGLRDGLVSVHLVGGEPVDASVVLEVPVGVFPTPMSSHMSHQPWCVQCRVGRNDPDDNLPTLIGRQLVYRCGVVSLSSTISSATAMVGHCPSISTHDRLGVTVEIASGAR